MAKKIEKSKPMPKSLQIEKYGEVWPAEMGTCADLLWKLDVERKALQKKADAIEARQIGLRKFIIDNLPASKATGIAGKMGRIKIEFKRVTKEMDWEKFYAFVLKQKRPDLLQRRVSVQAVEELIENGVKVPGVKFEDIKTVSLGKV